MESWEGMNWNEKAHKLGKANELQQMARKGMSVGVFPGHQVSSSPHSFPYLCTGRQTEDNSFSQLSLTCAKNQAEVTLQPNWVFYSFLSGFRDLAEDNSLVDGIFPVLGPRKSLDIKPICDAGTCDIGEESFLPSLSYKTFTLL